jgi:2-polyprenyl-3-methyl-5-hydroxy-6-metoxy-1,4-benzoquinol methylase
MSEAVRAHYISFPTPTADDVPVGSGQLERIDDNLHYGWAWHRYRYCFRRNDHLRILDAGCGTGLTTLGLARLNAGSNVLGVDFSAPALAIARERAQAAGLEASVAFREHDLIERLPRGLEPFDFIVCRSVLGHVANSGHLLENLSRVLDARGLLVATFPSRAGWAATRQFRRAIAALCRADAGLEERAEVGIQLFRSLRPEHPIRRLEDRHSGPNGPSAARLIARYLGPESREWELEEAIAEIERAGLKFLYAAATRPWSADRAFAAAVPENLKARVQALGEREQAILIDALDPTMHPEEYRLHACPADFEPRLPSWPDERLTHPEVFDGLIPHVTGLARPLDSAPQQPVPRGPALYAAVTGGAGPIDPIADALFREIDGRKPCGEIGAAILARSGVVETPSALQNRWLELANHGFILLESTDPRQHVDCVHVGPIRDRLDCPCPRRWVRACERHGFCSIDLVEPGDVHYPALAAALARLQIERIISCARCPDYVADEPHFPESA